MQDQMIIAQISDPHFRTDGLLRNHVDSMAAMRACVDHLNGMEPRPDLIVITGDLVNGPGDYAELRRMLDELAMPFHVIPGNHDFPEELRAAFGDRGYLPMDGFLHYVIEDYPVRLIALDTMLAGEIKGALCQQRLKWLDGKLSEKPNHPTVILMHHPPAATGVAFMDRQGLSEGAEALEEIVRRHSQVERILCGHVHRPVTLRWAGTVVSAAPSVSFQMRLSLGKNSVASYVMEPAACAVFLWRPDIGLAGHLSFIGDYGPARRFKEEDEND